MTNFKFDSTISIGSVLNALKTEGVKTADVAKAIQGISEKPLRAALKVAGYEFSNKAPKGWHYVGEQPEPLHKSIFDYVKRSNLNVKDNSPKVTKSHTDVKDSNTSMKPSNTDMKSNSPEVLPPSPIIHAQFTQEEIHDLINMLHEWRMAKSMADTNTKDEKKTVHERIKDLQQNEKTRKTIVIDVNIGERLDQYCKSEKVNKSDILHLAIQDFLNRYDM
jgi:hypothetical protein